MRGDLINYMPLEELVNENSIKRMTRTPIFVPHFKLEFCPLDSSYYPWSRF